MMKKICALIVFMTVCGAALFAQSRRVLNAISTNFTIRRVKMRKNTICSGLIGAAPVMGFVLSSCATTLGGGRPPTPDKQAEGATQLTADLNAIKAGSATVEGATVRLSGGFVWLQSDLTVPAGVTLDVTADVAALGPGNVTLTVNGRVNAGLNHVRMEDRASEAVINGSGIIRLNSKGRLLYVQGNKANRKLTLDGVTLTGLADNYDSLVFVGEGGEFVLKSGALMGNTYYKKEGWPAGGGLGVGDGTFTMKGGRIQGGMDSDGFAKNTVYEDSDGWWSMVLGVYKSTVKWGAGGTSTQGETSYDKGGPKAGGSDIVNLNNGGGGVSGTLIAIPAPQHVLR
jgi:hypothetical protein